MRVRTEFIFKRFGYIILPFDFSKMVFTSGFSSDGLGVLSVSGSLIPKDVKRLLSSSLCRSANVGVALNEKAARERIA